MSSSESERKQRQLVRAKVVATTNRQSTITRIQFISNMAKRVHEEPTLINEFLAAAQDLDSLWDKFMANNEAVLNALLDLDLLAEFSSDLECQVRALYTSTVAVVKRINADNNTFIDGDCKVNDNCLSGWEKGVAYGSRLPEIPLPSFSGSLFEWPVFHDRFDALVGRRTDLSNIERFYYLLGCLKGEALQAIHNIPVSEANYTLAWSSLVERFHKPRQLAVSIVEKLLASTVHVEETLSGLKEFVALFSDNITLLKSLRIPDLSDFLLFSLSSRCLPLATRRRFEAGFVGDFPGVENLMSFVKSRVATFEVAGTPVFDQRTIQPTGKFRSSTFASTKLNRKPHAVLISTKATGSVTRITCSFCEETHANEKCHLLTSMSVADRSNLCREKSVCFQCLSPSHWSNKCKLRKPCKHCNRRHHTLLHSSSKITAAPTAQTSNVGHTTLVGRSDQPAVLLGTALVHVRDSVGVMHSVRALIDSASQISAISTDCVNRLGLRRKKWTVPLSGLAGVSVPNVEGVVDCDISPRYAPGEIMPIKAWILPQVTSSMPTRQLPNNVKDKFTHLALADPEFFRPAPVDLLLGADVFSQVFDGKRVSVDNNYPTAYSTLFGWVIIGTISDTTITNHASHLVSLTVSLEDAMERFWRIEEPEPAPPTFTDEGKCEEIYLSKRSRDASGRFEVPLPFRGPIEKEQFPGSRQVALRRFENLERKLKSDTKLHQAYVDFMRDYLSSGHMSIAPEPGMYFLPHHAVFKSSPVIKIRVVFDASSQVASGHSLNSRLYTGPKLQQDIVDILLRFRVHKFVFTADVCQMYRQILIQPPYKPFQHIFWRESPLHELKEYQLNTVTYGMSCAPYLALRVLKDIAEQDCSDFPAVRDAILSQTYIDDMCVGADTVSHILKLQCDLENILKGAGFQLKKWISNVEEVLLAVLPEDRLLESLQFDSETVGVTKVLGIQWDAPSDLFSYDVQPLSQVTTKRGVLSVIARIFDPLGFLAPAIFYAKFILQSIWRIGVSWDERLPPDLADKWQIFMAELPMLSKVKIPRYLGTYIGYRVILCGFCDASERGYAATVYVRLVASDGSISVSLLGTKTKMAPMKSSTIPRLELCSAVLLARWMSRLKVTLDHKLFVTDVFAWSDSQIVLSWLNTPHTNFKIFVSNRVHQIHELMPQCTWNYIPSSENPADCASRGITPGDLIRQSLYWSGPDMLRQPLVNRSCDWSQIPVDQLPETKIVSLTTTIDSPTEEWFNRFSSYTRMIRVTAFLRRFIGRCRKQSYIHRFLTSSELQEALLVIVRSSQKHSFGEWFSNTVEGKRLPRHLAGLQPMIDHRGVICVGGRLQNSDLPHEQKHPILLSKTSHLSKLLVRHWHLATCHAGPRLIASLVMRKFWIVSIRVVIRNVRSKCNVCVRLAAQNPQPLMAELPGSRVQSCRPFSRVGIDFAGPLSMRECMLRKARQYKVYIAIFVCMTIKAVHIEVVSSLSTEAFLAAFDRFVARRGLPQDIFSDCGTNFVGAANCLRRLINQEEHRQVITSHSACSWHFNPPGAPHFGGLWEAAIRSVKTLLVRTLGSHNPTLEELSTVLCRIEAALNSRPLTPMSSSSQDLDYLTPGHFLIGQPLLAVPETPVSEETRLISRWKLLNQCCQAFWRRWSSEYLSSLQNRTKWSKTQPNIKVGDMVIVKNNSTPPLTWLLGRVITVFPGKDGIVRVARVLTKQGEVIRPVVKLVLLPTG